MLNNCTSKFCLTTASHSNNSGDDIHDLLQIQHAILLPLNVLNILLNSLTVGTVVVCMELHNVPNILISFLALNEVIEGILSLCSDLLFFARGMECSRNCEYNFSNDHQISVALIRFIVDSCFTCNYLSLLAIAGQQWLYITKPFLHDRMITRRLTTAALVLFLVASYLVNLDIIVLYPPGQIQSDEYVRRVLIVPLMHTAISLIMFVLYFHIAFVAVQKMRSQLRRVADVSTCPSLDASRISKVKSELKVLQMFLTTFGVFFTFLSPVVYYRVYLGDIPPSFGDWRTVFVLETLPAFHYVTNFFVFAILHKDLNKCFKTLFRKLKYYLKP